MVKPRSFYKVVLESNDSFEHVQFYQNNDKYIAITKMGLVYSGDIPINNISVIYNLKSASTSFILFNKQLVTLALIALENGSLVLLNIGTKTLMGSHSGFGEIVTSIFIHPHSARAITTLQHCGIVWDVSNDTPVPLHRLDYPRNITLLKVFFGPNGDNINTCFADGTVIAWDFPSLEYQTQLPNTSVETSVTIDQVAVSHDATLLLSLTSDSKLLLSDLTGSRKFKTMVFPSPYLTRNITQMEILTSSKHASIAVLLTETGILVFFNLTSGEVLAEFSAKLGKYVKFSVPSSLTEHALIPTAAILNGNLELLNVTSIIEKSAYSSKGLPKQYTETVHKSGAVKQPVKMNLEKKSTQVIRIYEFENMLNKFGEFPEKYRTLIWKYLLRLPLNQESFSTLLARGVHPAYAKLEETYPVTDIKLLTAFKRILSSIAHWCALFAEVSYLPTLVFPFVKVFYTSPIICFEILLTYLVNWCHDWFQFYPAPPYHVFAKIETILEKMSPKLLSHFKAHGITCRDYTWPLLESSFSDVFTTDEWLRIWDHIFASQDQHFLYSLVAAYASASENTLIRCTKLEDFQKYFHDKNPVPVKVVLEIAKQVDPEFSKSLPRFQGDNRPFVPLPDGTYPIFTNFPMTAVKNHAKQMEKIRKMEAEYLNERKTVYQIEAEYGSLQEQEEAWKRNKAILRAADQLQKQEANYEEQRLQDQRTRLQILKRELQRKECALLESKKRHLQWEYRHRSEVQVARLEDTCRWIGALRETELAEYNAEAEQRYFKQKMEKCAYEINLLKEDANMSTEVDDCLHRISENNFTVKSGLPATSERTVKRDQLKTDHKQVEIPMKSTVYTLEEQLNRLEKNNKSMERELKEMMQSLATS